MLYLLTMVLLPYAHLIIDHHSQPDAHAQCSHPHEPADTNPGNSEQKHDKHCSICDLLILASEPSPVYSPIVSTECILRTEPSPVSVYIEPDLNITGARDPPYILMI